MKKQQSKFLMSLSILALCLTGLVTLSACGKSPKKLHGTYASHGFGSVGFFVFNGDHYKFKYNDGGEDAVGTYKIDGEKITFSRDGGWDTNGKLSNDKKTIKYMLGTYTKE